MYRFFRPDLCTDVTRFSSCSHIFFPRQHKHGYLHGLVSVLRRVACLRHPILLLAPCACVWNTARTWCGRKPCSAFPVWCLWMSRPCALVAQPGSEPCRCGGWFVCFVFIIATCVATLTQKTLPPYSNKRTKWIEPWPCRRRKTGPSGRGSGIWRLQLPEEGHNPPRRPTGGPAAAGPRRRGPREAPLGD